MFQFSKKSIGVNLAFNDKKTADWSIIEVKKVTYSFGANMGSGQGVRRDPNPRILNNNLKL